MTALALKHFRTTRVEIVILETGLGGRLDATNAMQPDVSVITPIDFDHEKWLGKTIPEIAAEKAGIIKPGVPIVSACQRAEAEEVIRARAAKCGAPLQFVTRPYDKTPIALARIASKAKRGACGCCASRSENRCRRLSDCTGTRRHRLASAFSTMGRAHNRRWRA